VSGLTVAVTGPTFTFGFGLIPLLQADDRIARIVGVARRPSILPPTVGPRSTAEVMCAIRLP
jgi:hypothetical protein